MAATRDEIADAVNIAFAKSTPLRKQVFDAMQATPQYVPLFGDIANYITNGQTPGTNGTIDLEDNRLTKKRKLDNGASAPAALNTTQTRTVVLEARDISFQLPQRKKLHLSIVQYGESFQGLNTTFSLCIRSPASSQIEYEYPLTTFDYALCVPVPEKATKQYNYCFLPSNHSESEAVQLPPGEGVIWTINHGPLKSCTLSSPDLQALITSDRSEILPQAFDIVLKRSGRSLTSPTESEFACAIPESHRKNDKAYHVKAHRGSKDGYLWFLPTGIFFGFKKPLAFFPFHQVESVSYTSVLQRTFNLVIITTPDPKSAPQEVEFSMLDQAEFAGIDAYIKKHGLQDASMAEARKAKHFKVNGKAAADGEGDGVGELEKAEQEAIDEEDEMEEDYDPEADDDSDGSGSSEDDEDGGHEDASGRNLVEEELGSEAEEIEEEEDEGAEGEEEEGEEEEGEEEEEVKTELVKQTKIPERVKEATKPLRRIPSTPSFDDDDQL